MKLILRQGLERAVKDFSEKVCIRFKTKTKVSQYTYQEVYDSTLKIAAWLSSIGVKKGDRVGLILENRPQWPISYLGIISSGAVAVPVDNQLSFEEAAYCLKDSQAKVVFVSGALSYLKNLEQLDFLEKVVVVEPAYASKGISLSEILSTFSPADLPAQSPQDLASIIYTSGTTATPKGVMLTHQNFYANYLSTRRLNLIKSSDRVLSVLPLHHSYAFVATLISPLFSGAEIIYIEALEAGEILRALKEEEITIMVVVPQILSLFYRRIREKLETTPFFLKIFPLNRLLFAKIRAHFGAKLRFFVCGGAKLEREVAVYLSKIGFKILEGYGLTEASPTVSFNPPGAPKIGSVGRALPGVEVKILNPDPEGIGEILVKGANVMPGYYQRPQETQETLKGGWLYSGDLGYIDKQGYIFIKDRIKEVIVLKSGKNISPQEVEQNYLKSPFIKEICVLPGPKEESLAAVVVPDLAHFKQTKQANVQDVVKWNLGYLAQKMPPYKRVRDFILVNADLPRTRLGKVQRFKVSRIYKENYRRKPPKKDLDLKALSPAGLKVVGVLKKAGNLKRISLDDHLDLDLGLDSLERIEVIMALEKALGITIKEEDFSQVFTVRELIANIERLSVKKEGVPEERDSLFWKKILSSLPSEGLIKRIELKLNPGSKLFTLLGALFMDGVFRLFFRLKVSGSCGLPRERFILCPNHTSYLDGFIVFSALPLKLKYKLFFLGLSQYFELPVIKGLVKYMRVVPVDLSGNVVEALKAAALILRGNKNLCIFPEGSRSIDGEIKEFKGGAGILAQELNVKVVPVYIAGAFAAWKATRRFPKPHPIKVIFGPACSFTELRARGKKLESQADDYQAIGLGLKEEIRILKESSRAIDEKGE